MLLLLVLTLAVNTLALTLRAVVRDIQALTERATLFKKPIMLGSAPVVYMYIFSEKPEYRRKRAPTPRNHW